MATAALSLSAPLDGLADTRAIIAWAAKALRLPKRLRLSEWADEKFYLSPESAAEPGRWRTIPYQRGIMDAITDPRVEQVSVMKSARVGWTKILDATIGHYMEQDPCPILAVQPTVEDAEGFSKEEIDPMLRDCPALRNVVRQSSKRDGKNTILHKRYAGGVLSMVGANSGRGFRRTSRKIIALDEVDGYPPSAGKEGDPISLAIKRSEYYWDRKILIGSTPLIAGVSRIEEEFRKGDQRRYYVPCPQCGHMDFLTFRQQPLDGGEPRGHYMKWPEGKPEEAFFVCRKTGCVIEHRSKTWMVERGEWRASAPFKRHASFHIWAAYSYSPNATWGHIAVEFEAANTGGTEKLKTFVNTALGETWTEKGEAPEWRRLYDRREQYARGTVPAKVLFLTAGVDVQKDRLEWEVVGWCDDRQSWSIDIGTIAGDPAKEETWFQADELLSRTFPGADGTEHPIRVLAVDSGFETQSVYNWARRHVGRVIACKGMSGAPVLLGSAQATDVTYQGRRIARGCKYWPVGVDIAKSELYGQLSIDRPTKESGQPYPPGYCHFPEYDEEYFKQLTAEHRVSVRRKSGHVHLEWQVMPGRQNHRLDGRVYARAAAQRCGLDQLAAAREIRAAAERGPAPASPPKPKAKTSRRETGAPEGGGWLGPRRGGTLGGGGWFRRKR